MNHARPMNNGILRELLILLSFLQHLPCCSLQNFVWHPQFWFALVQLYLLIVCEQLSALEQFYVILFARQLIVYMHPCIAALRSSWWN
jgi:hypothetical protein